MWIQKFVKQKFITNNQLGKKALSFVLVFALALIFSQLLIIGPAQADSYSIENPIGDEDSSFNFPSVAKNIRERLLTFVATLTIIVLVVAGIFYIFSQGNEQRTSQAKKVMTGAMIGLAIILSANTILKELYDIFEQPIEGDIGDPQSIADVVTKALKALLRVLSIIGIISLVWSGIMHLTSAGDTGKAEKAKKQAIYSVIGLVISIASYIIVNQIATILGYN
jgi:flagellar basal body-associated protein FliL